MRLITLFESTFDEFVLRLADNSGGAVVVGGGRGRRGETYSFVCRGGRCLSTPSFSLRGGLVRLLFSSFVSNSHRQNDLPLQRGIQSTCGRGSRPNAAQQPKPGENSFTSRYRAKREIGVTIASRFLIYFLSTGRLEQGGEWALTG